MATTSQIFSTKVLLVFSMVFLASCTNDPTYYSRAKFTGVGGEHARISVDLFVNEPSKSNSKTALNLSSRGQAAFIQAYAASPEKLTEALALSIKGKNKASFRDRSKLITKRQLTFTVVTSRMHPADRVVEARVIATLPDDWHFKNWSGFEVVDSDVKAATVVNTLGAKLKASTGFDFSNIIRELIDSNIEAEISSSNEVTRDLQFDVIEFLPRLSKSRAEFLLSAPFQQINLAGSYTVDVSLEYNPKKSLYAQTTHFNLGDPDAVSVTQPLMGFPTSADEVIIDVSMPYVVRLVEKRVGSGATSLTEDDDYVEYRSVDSVADALKENTEEAQLGTEVPSTQQSMELSGQTKASVSLILMQGIPLKIFLPESHSTQDDASCILNNDGKNLQEFVQWLSSAPEQRLTLMTGSDIKWVILNGSTNQAIDSSTFRAALNAGTIEINRVPLNYDSQDLRFQTVYSEACYMDVAR